MLKEYIDRGSYVVTPVNVVKSVPKMQSEMDSEEMNSANSDPSSSKLQTSDILKDLNQKLSHLDPAKGHRTETVNL